MFLFLGQLLEKMICYRGSKSKTFLQIIKHSCIFWSFLPQNVYKTLVPLESFQKDLSINILVFLIIRLHVVVIVKSVNIFGNFVKKAL